MLRPRRYMLQSRMGKVGRPRIVGFACPRCGQDHLICRSTQKQGSLLARYYKCAICGHRGILIAGASRTWWQDMFRPALSVQVKEKPRPSLPLLEWAAQQKVRIPYSDLPLFNYCS